MPFLGGGLRAANAERLNRAVFGECVGNMSGLCRAVSGGLEVYGGTAFS